MDDPRHNRGRGRYGGGRVGQDTAGRGREGGRSYGGYESGGGSYQRGSSGGSGRYGGGGGGGRSNSSYAEGRRGYADCGGQGRGYGNPGSSSYTDGRGGYGRGYGNPGSSSYTDGRGGYGRGYGNPGSSSYTDGRGGGRGGRNLTPPCYVPVLDSFEDQVSKLQISPKPKLTDDRQKKKNKGVVASCPPQGGQVALYNVDILVNHFKLRFNFERNFNIFHYEFDVKRKDRSSAKVNKLVLFDIMKGYFQNDSQLLAFDGGRNIFTPDVLTEGHSSVTCGDVDYLVDVKLQKRITVADLSCKSPSRMVLHGLDIIMRQHAASDRLSLGSSSFYSTKEPQYLNVHSKVAFLQGFRQSIKSTESGLVLCVDHSVMPFEKPVSIIDFLKQKLKIVISHTTVLGPGQKIDVANALLGVRVQRTYFKVREKQKVHGLTDKTCDKITFVDHTSNEVKHLAEYFWEKYKLNIQYSRLPCLSLNKKNDVFVPMEFCILAEWKKCPMKALSSDEDRMLRSMALLNPNIRREKINKIVNGEDGLRCSGSILNGFSMELNRNMEEAKARVLHRPNLTLRMPNDEVFEFPIAKDDCQWNLLKNKLSNGMKLRRWGVLEFTSARSNSSCLRIDEFIPEFVNRCVNLGIATSPPSVTECQSDIVLANPVELRKLLNHINGSVPGGLQIIICPIPVEHEGYKILKYICEVELGIMTQCCISFKANKPNGRDQYLANLALKINAKLGGVNFEVKANRLLGSYLQKPIMFIGADVNHPRSGDPESLSIAAVVGSVNWPASSYFSIMQAQKHRKESIVGVGEMCHELVEKYHKAHGFKPMRIIYFRDGVSDSQFDMVRQDEFQDIKKWIVTADYNPEITVVVTQKRHQTRLFHKEGCAADKNVLPGTVVDRGITAPGSFNFYLCSHNGLMGTSKPGHYYVLHDDYGFKPDELEMLTYTLCYTFARCTKPVSYATPVYYADIVAYRGRQYHDAMLNLGVNLLPPSSELCRYRFPVHGAIIDKMYFL